MSTLEPVFSLCYTSRRPKMIADVINLWRARAKDVSRVEIILAVDADDAESIATGQKLAHLGVILCVQNDAPFNCVKGWNLAAAKSTGKVLIAIADDFIPPKNWDQGLLDVQVEHEAPVNGLPGWVFKSRIIHVNDGYIDHIATLAIVTRVRYLEFGYLFWPMYQSMFSDTELTERAKLDGAVIRAKHLFFEHLHPQNNKRSRDNVDMVHDSKARWAHGEAMFELRRREGFPRPGEVVRLKFAAYVMANKDDLCALPVMRRLLEQGVHDFFFCINNEYWSGRPTTDAEANQILEVARQLTALGAHCRTRRFSTLPYRNQGLKRLDIETLVRNDQLAWMRAEGFCHLLIVDSDELWKPDLVAMVEEAVKLYTPDAIKCWRVPVVGLPGVLVNEPRDNPEIYIGNQAKFKLCRAVEGKSVLISGFGVYHFTAVRRDVAAIVDKHRESGHYDDTNNYDFEGWIRQTLPKLVTPGEQLKVTRAHMYRKDNIWPGVRPWTTAELRLVPDELKVWCDTANAVDAPMPLGPGGAGPAGQWQPLPREEPVVRKATPFPVSRLASPSLYRRV